MDKENAQKGLISLRELYPELSESELQLAKDNLDRYLDHMLAVHARLYPNLPLTLSGDPFTIENKGRINNSETE